MGTRGIYGLYKNGITKTTYSHWDSYPTELGEKIVEFIKSTSVEEMNQIFEKIKLVKRTSKPTAEQISECMNYFDDKVGERDIEDWYCLLRKSQGTLIPYKRDLKYMIDSEKFIADSLFCEWGYIINLNNNELEIYVGFQTKPNDNRYKIDKPDEDGYYNCDLFKSIPLNKITKNTMIDIKAEYDLSRKARAL